ncbi:MAG: YHS domain-containing protein [Acidobacteria bacterium]|nr:YHS domain-containing protein [Acidobacteriota bacterium]
MATHIDPVCGIQLEGHDAAGLSEYQGTTYYFHTEDCLRTFNQHPEQYAGSADQEQPGDAPGRKNNDSR